uniref:Zinc finger BED domain-containing protein DAYSLEEPER n=1 Tax=Noccaea caerulescens TaxID=107243 RepID=A0A1J3J0E5_NOCCA
MFSQFLLMFIKVVLLIFFLFLGNFQGFYTFFSQAAGGSGMSALDKYLDEPVLDMIAFRSLNVLGYWRDNANRFKELATMAWDVLSIPIITVASKSSFSIGSRVLNKYKSSLLLSNVKALICARNWLRGFEEIDDQFEFSNFDEDNLDKEGEEEV